MPVNVEIKARIKDVEQVRRTAEALSDTPCQVLDQEDTFFGSKAGRLKLRQRPDSYGELIFYERPDSAEPKPSEYVIYRSSNPELLKEMLSAAVGTIGVVKKRRLLYLVGQTRVHLDTVEGLGSFLELEVVLRPGQTVDEGRRIANALVDQLNIQQEQLVTHAYMDLLLANQS